jgi:hypothetical protein
VRLLHNWVHVDSDFSGDTVARSQPYKRPSLAEVYRAEGAIVETPLLNWMIAHNISAFVIAQELKCSPNVVCNWAKGHSLPSLVYAFKLGR